MPTSGHIYKSSKCPIFVALLIGFCSFSNAEIRFPLKPAEGKFIVDQASLLSASSITQLQETQLTKLLSEMAIPIIFVSIQSQQDFGAGGMSIETYARILYDEWGIGHQRVLLKAAELEGQRNSLE